MHAQARMRVYAGFSLVTVVAVVAVVAVFVVSVVSVPPYFEIP
jgi:hypothetical protein